MIPQVGFNDTSPFQAAGIRTEPPVSEPSAAKQIPDETATAESSNYKQQGQLTSLKIKYFNSKIFLATT